MIINNIPYVSINTHHLSSIASCITMVLKYNGVKIKDGEIDSLYQDTYSEYMFNNNIIDASGVIKKDDNITLSCGLWVLRKYFKSISSDLIDTELSRIHASYIKRKMPVIITGNFPLKDLRTSNSIVIKGGIDNYLIANDPKGNANSWYRDRHGENVIYSIDDIYKWTNSIAGKITLLRIG